MSKPKAGVILQPVKKEENFLKKDSEFLCRVKYSNRIPDIPFEPKLLHYPFEVEENFVVYKPTSLEANAKHVVHAEPDAGLNIDLIDPDAYIVPEAFKESKMDPKDEEIIRDNSEKQDSKIPTSRKLEGNLGNVSWLRKTAYLSNEEQLPRFQRSGESDIGWGRTDEQDPQADSIDDKINIIEKSFEQMKELPVHQTNPNLKPKRVYSIFPNFECWGNNNTCMEFDSEPFTKSAKTEDNKTMKEIESKGIINGFDSTYVEYLCPKQQKEEAFIFEEGLGEYERIRFYHFKFDKTPGTTYFFEMDEDENKIKYSAFDNKLILTKVKDKQELIEADAIPKPEKYNLINLKRQFSEEFKDTREVKMMKLENNVQ